MVQKCEVLEGQRKTQALLHINGDKKIWQINTMCDQVGFLLKKYFSIKILLGQLENIDQSVDQMDYSISSMNLKTRVLGKSEEESRSNRQEKGRQF